MVTTYSEYNSYYTSIIYTPIWMVEEEEVGNFLPLIGFNDRGLNGFPNEIKNLIRCLNKACDLSYMVVSAGGIKTAASPLNTFIDRWNAAVESISRQLRQQTRQQLIQEYNEKINAAVEGNRLFKIKPTITERLVLEVYTPGQFSDLFYFAGIATYSTFHPSEGLEQKANIPRIMHVTKHGEQTVRVQTLNPQPVPEQWCPPIQPTNIMACWTTLAGRNNTEPLVSVKVFGSNVSARKFAYQLNKLNQIPLDANQMNIDEYLPHYQVCTRKLTQEPFAKQEKGYEWHKVFHNEWTTGGGSREWALEKLLDERPIPGAPAPPIIDGTIQNRGQLANIVLPVAATQLPNSRLRDSEWPLPAAEEALWAPKFKRVRLF
ncbi:capsid triplex subunit 1 [Anguillid herpesvirus 1]|uniref:Capsid triplex subunit 1 n=1 Tax=Anguillid herpesvirus 1 TaxID=150286 RepID=A0A1J0RED5_9VIRU|nr:capsid triplex subunit 1 [Anguillid herpesvirus 1]ADA57805.1 capsid triplex subunit 1 [Anguillid herpesvirus 1]APD76205.1 capsid triplex subunit 1 [Anguillid herpesvirus 1]QRM16335.1 capsid triplex subunit 1 [Anguillid herpesvirus 1]QRM16465.1 capsid triplex subunit 1 [Anguillid herpesvirus 1]QRM16594.1 capsid triplex subunit 1 [Anguillid herpesvirus 1]